MKICFKCSKEKPLIDFYKHPQMSDGRVNKCKECNKLDIKKDYYRKSEDINFVESERVRSREKYKRLDYNTRSKILTENKPWTKSNIYKQLSKKFNIPKGFELHHWNYNNEFLEDIIILKIKEHRQAHTHLELDLSVKIFKTKEGILLDSKEKHIQFLLEKEIKF